MTLAWNCFHAEGCNEAKCVVFSCRLQESFESRFRDFHREEESMMAFINPFSLSEQQIVKLPSNIQMEMIDLQATSSLKIKFNELPVVQ